MRRSAEEALTLADHAEAVGATFVRLLPITVPAVVAGSAWYACTANAEPLAGRVQWSTPLHALALTVLSFVVLPVLLGLLVRRPGPGDARDIMRICHVVGSAARRGTLWIGRRALHLHLGDEPTVLEWSTISEIRVESPGAFSSIFGMGPSGYPLVIVRAGEPDVRLHVVAPVSVARSMRRAMASAGAAHQAPSAAVRA